MKLFQRLSVYLFFVSVAPLCAQQYSAGLVGGPSLANFWGPSRGSGLSPLPGISAGLSGKIRLREHYALRSMLNPRCIQGRLVSIVIEFRR